MQTRLTIRLDFDETRRLGPGKVALLESIDETGSISAAGRAHAMSYRKAWLLVEEMNRMFASPLVAARPGGVKGGGAEGVLLPPIPGVDPADAVFAAADAQIRWYDANSRRSRAWHFRLRTAQLIFATAVQYMPWLAPLEGWITVARYGVATLVLVIALLLVHAWLPAGRRTLREILPGIVATLLLWLLCGVIFGRYLAQFAQTYVTYYSSLSSAMIALVFLYFTALIFVYGGELNHALSTLRDKFRR